MLASGTGAALAVGWSVDIIGGGFIGMERAAERDPIMLAMEVALATEVTLAMEVALAGGLSPRCC